MTTRTAQEQANIRALEGFMQHVLNDGDVGRAQNYLSDRLVDHSLPPGVPASTEGFRAWFQDFHSTYPDARWTIDVLAADGDLVARHQTFTATHAPSGRRVTAGETGIARFADGKLVEYWGVFDEAGLAHQLAEVEPVST